MIYGSHHALFTPGCEVLLKVQILRYTQYNFPEDEEYHLMPKNKLQELLKFLGCSEETVPKIQPGSVPKIQPESSKSEILKDEKSIDDETKYDVSSESNCNVALPVMKDAFDDNDNHVSGDEDEDSNEDEDSTEDEASDTEDIPQNDSAITCILECDPPALPDEQVDYKIFKVNDEALETCKYETNDNISTGVTGEIGLSIVKEQVDQNSGNVRPKRKRKQIKDLSESASFDNDSVSDGGIDAIKRSTRKKGRTEKNIKQGKSIKRAKRFSLTTKDRDGVECVKLVTKKELYVNKEYQCCDCDFKTDNLGCLKRHTRIHKDNDAFRCQDCGRNFTTYAVYKSHRLKTDCEAKWVQIHTVRQVLNVELKCPRLQCKHTTRSPLDYVNHLINKHNQKDDFKCPFDMCGYTTLTRSCFARHVMRHDETQLNYCCSLCDRKFHEYSQLTGHLKKYHCDPGSDKFDPLVFMTCECEECDFIDHRQYSTHMRDVHSIHAPFKCPFPVCVLKTGDFQDFSRHLVTHLSKRRHKCEICGMSFVRSQNLSNHIKTHGQPSFNCTMCDHSDIQRSQVIKHYMDTHGERSSGDMVKECFSTHMVTKISRKRFVRGGRVTNIKGSPHKQTCFYCTKCGYSNEQRSKVIKHHIDTHGREAGKMMVKKRSFSSTSVHRDGEKNSVKKCFVNLGSKAEICIEKGSIKQEGSCIVKYSGEQVSEAKLSTKEGPIEQEYQL